MEDIKIAKSLGLPFINNNNIKLSGACVAKDGKNVKHLYDYQTAETH